MQEEPFPSMSKLAAAARANAGLPPTTMVSQTTGVAPKNSTINLTREDDDDDDRVRVEDVTDDKDDGDQEYDPHANEAQEPVISENYGHGMRIRKRPESYEPSMTGKSYQTGIINLCYRGARYSLSDITPGEGEIPYNMGILNMNCEPPVKEASRDWMNDSDLEEQMMGVILVQQFNLKKGIELFGDQVKEATTKELQQIHNVGTYIPVMQKECFLIKSQISHDILRVC